jgi:hypothetical protein
MDLLGDEGQRQVHKPKMEIWLKKSSEFDALMAAEREAGGRNRGGAANGDSGHADGDDAEEGEEGEEHEGSS